MTGGLGWPVLLAMLAGALLHAGWNAMVKSGTDKAADIALVTMMAGLIALPLCIAVGLPQAATWPFVAASLVIHIGYYVALVGAYEHGDLGLTYPIMRGFAPLLVALASGAVIGESLSTAAWFGVVGITLGVSLVGLAHPGEALHHRKALGFAFANAGVIAAYTIVDGLGVRATGEPMRYALLLFVLDAVPFAAMLWWWRGRGGRQGRPALVAYVRHRWPVAAVGGAAAFGSYAVALWAMGRAPVASVAALRETSVLFAALIGTWMLKERFGLQRALGTVVIVGSVIALRIG